MVKRVGEHLLSTAQAWRSWWPSSPVSAPGTGNCHIDLLCYLIPGQALITQLHDLLSGGGMCGSATTHTDAGTAQMLADRGLRAAQFGTDLAQGPAPRIQVGCIWNVHCATVTAARAAGP